jgi:opacity protein-like surface antigen
MKSMLQTLSIALLCATAAASAEVVDERLAEYQAQGAGGFSAAAGEALWNSSSGQARSCTACHTADLRAAGKHAETGKRIEPMKPAVNPERLTDARQIEKWFLRNCKWTFGRECTPQEKGDFLMFIRN